MKYSKTNQPLVCMQTQSTCYKGTTKMEVKGVLWHSTAANNPTLKRYVQPSDNAPDRDEWLKKLGVNTYKNDWNHIVHRVGMNCWIGKLADGTVTTVQTMPWDFKPWGCGAGNKGSLNNGWIQFEICEDGLTDKNYFEAVYKEACEITAYLCEMFDIDPKGTVDFNGVKVPTIVCHADSYKLGMGSNHGDVYHWFKKYNKDMTNVRNDVAELLKDSKPVVQPTEKPVEKKSLYRVRKSWTNSQSQIGAYAELKNAKEACDANPGYFVYDENGKQVYPEVIETPVKPVTTTFKVGDTVKLVEDATYSTGTKIPTWVFKYKLYVREILKNGTIVISTQRTGAVTGTVKPDAIVAFSASTTTNTPKPAFTPYLVRVTTAVLNVRAGAGTQFKITTQVKKNDIYTIVDEKNGWGKLKSGKGWISLDYTQKVK